MLPAHQVGESIIFIISANCINWPQKKMKLHTGVGSEPYFGWVNGLFFLISGKASDWFFLGIIIFLGINLHDAQIKSVNERKKRKKNKKKVRLDNINGNQQKRKMQVT